MRRLLKAIIIITGLGILTLFALQWATASRITTFVSAEINKQLTAEVKVAKVSFSLFRGFPWASAVLHDVFIPDAVNPDGADTLFHCRTLMLQFRIIDLLRVNKNIKRVEIRDGEINIRYFEDGSFNYDILKPSSGAESSPLFLELQSVVVKDTRFRLTYADPFQDYQFDIHNVKLSGSIEGQLLNLKAKGHGITRNVEVEDLLFVPGAEVEINTQLKADLDSKRYEFAASKLIIDDQELSFSGVIEDARRWLELHISGDELSMEKGIHYLPESITKQWPEFEIESDYSATCAISGSYKGRDLPRVVVQFAVESGLVNKIGPLEQIHLNGIKGTVFYMDPKMPAELILNIAQFELRSGKDTLRGSARVDGIEKLAITSNITGSLQPGNYLRLLPSKPVDTVMGRVRVAANLSIEDLDPNALTDVMSHIKGKADLEFVDMTVTAQDNTLNIQELNGSLSWLNGSIGNMRLSANTTYGLLSIKGSIPQTEGLFDGFKSGVEGNLSITTPLLKYTSPPADKGATKTSPLPPLENVVLSVKLAADSFSIDDYSGHNLRTSINLENGELSFNNLKCNVFGGEVSGRGNFSIKSEGDPSYAVEFETKKIDIQKVFHAADNFNQKSLTEHNIAGSLSTEFQATGPLNSSWQVDQNSLIASVHVMINDGRLFDFKPIESVAKYIRVDDLSRISFATLENEIQIRNGEMIIPEMRIVSDAASLSISGVQKFNGEIDYHIAVALSEVLSNKAKRNPDNLNNLVQGDNNKSYIYLHITGTTENPRVRYDKREAKAAITNNLIEQKNEVKSLLNSEFGLFRKNPPPAPRQTEKKPRYRLEPEPD